MEGPPNEAPTQAQVPPQKNKGLSVGFNLDLSVIHVYERSYSLDSSASDQDESKNWKKRDFLISLIALTVGFGNIYRFPFAAYRNGGGTFLIAYIIMHTLVVRPVYFLQLALGQFTSSGQVKMWSLAPIFKGVGYGSMVGTIAAVSYYASTMAMLMFYFFSSFKTKLPWSICNPKWVGPGDDWGSLQSAVNEAVLGCNATDLSAAFDTETGERSSVSLAQLYFKNEVVKSKNDIEDGLGQPDWKLALCLLVSWVLVWRALLGGVKLGGKMSYITSIVSYVLLTILFIRAVTLPNAWEGIRFFITPDWAKILNARVWYAAVTQCLFSLNTGFGPLTMLGSYNRFDHNMYKDAWIVSVIDLFTSIFAGVTVFAVLGNLAGTLDVEIEQVTYAENELALIVFAQGVTTFSWLPQLFSILFYLMLFVLGMITATAYVGAVVTVINDQFPKITRFYAASFISMCGFVIGLIYVTPGGSVMVRLADYYGARMVIYIMTAAEVTGVAWIYGADKFLKDLEFMLGKRLGWYWKFCWCYFIPGGCTAILIFALAQGRYAPMYKGEPIAGYSTILGWVFTLFAVSALPIGAFHSVLSIGAGGFKKKFLEALKPSDDWGPRRSDLRREWIQFKEKTS